MKNVSISLAAVLQLLGVALGIAGAKKAAGTPGAMVVGGLALNVLGDALDQEVEPDDDEPLAAE